MYRSNPSYPSIEDNSFYRPMYIVKPERLATQLGAYLRVDGIQK